MIEQLKDEVLFHAKETIPNECCGLAVVINGKLKYHKCRNLSLGSQFIVDPLDYAKAEELGSIVGVCHSHVNENPNPSQADLVGIEKTQLPWLIVQARTGEFTLTNPTGYKAPLIGRTFTHGVLDCYQIIKDYYEQELSIILPDPIREEQWWYKGQDLYRDNFESAGFVKVGGSDFTALNKHDVILMQVRSQVPNHGGVYVGDGMLLQHCTGRLSSRDVYGGYWRKVTNLVLRHKELM